jgi:hypothetical protein
LCLKSSEYVASSAYVSFGGFLSTSCFGIPSGIPDYQTLFSGYQNGAGGSPIPTNATRLSDRQLKAVKELSALVAEQPHARQVMAEPLDQDLVRRVCGDQPKAPLRAVR